MSENLIATVRARFDHAAQKKILKEKYQAKMLFPHNGGMWRAGPELISVLNACPDESAVLEDLYGIPVKVSVPDLIFLSQQRWQEQMNAWLDEWEQLQKQR